MVRTPLTLAALATAAVPGLEIARASWHSTGRTGDFDSALLETSGGRRVLIRVPTSPTAEIEQGADLVALHALSSGIRSHLPFGVPVVLGQAPYDGTRAVVYELLAGRPITVDDVTGERAHGIGRAIAAIHSLPSGFVGDAGLPVQSADEVRESTVAIIDRAASTGQLPAALRTRWLSAVADAALWRFQPTAVNGALSAESLLVDGDRVAAVIGWSGLAVGDPARDLAWLMSAHPDATGDALEAYERARQIGSDAALPRRALLHAEVDLARWLLHGHDLHDPVVIADAVALLDDLVDRVHLGGVDALRASTGPVLTISQVETMLAAGGPAGESYAAGFAPLDDIEESDGQLTQPIEPLPLSGDEDTEASTDDQTSAS
ncbi:phosphotransferase [Gryllotalpicola sp.]|uniref:phosphotransferase n=1 Tax=Gryllotalpicola sp. TaxID=1932787 RepID=UPI00262B2546|nr:phosphotransferase [Gryllotalpicola sp.]